MNPLPRVVRIFSRTHYHKMVIIMTLVGLSAGGTGIAALRSLEAEFVADTGATLALAADEIANGLAVVLSERTGEVRLIAHTLGTFAPTSGLWMPYFEVLQEHFRHCCPIAVADVQGRIVAATHEEAIGKVRSGSDWFVAAKERRSTTVQEVYSLHRENVPAVAISVPITDRHGTFLGVLTMHIGFPELEGTFHRLIRTLESQRQLAGRVQWLVLTNKGEILDESMTFLGGRLNLKSAGLPSAMAPMAEPAGYVEETHIRRHVPVLTGFADTRAYRGYEVPDWRVLVRIDRADVIAPIRTVMWKIGGSMALVIIPIVAMVFWWRCRPSLSGSAVEDESIPRIQASEPPVSGSVADVGRS